MTTHLKPVTIKAAGTILLLLLLLVPACDSGSPLDRAGEDVDDAIEKLSRQVDDTCEKGKDRNC